MGELKINPLQNVYKKYRDMNLINPYILTSVPVVSDPDAQAYINAGIIKNQTIANAVNQLAIDLKANSLWAKMQVIYPMAYNTELAHKLNLKDPRDLDIAFRIVFNGGTHTLDGWKGADSLSTGDTKFVPSAHQNVNSNGATLAIGQDGVVTNITDLRAGSINTQRTHINVKSTNVFVIRINGDQSGTVSNTDAKGVYTGQRVSSNVANGWKNGVKLINHTLANGTLPTTDIFLQGDKRFQSVFIHEGLSDTEVPILRTIIDTYENSLGRKTW